MNLTYLSFGSIGRRVALRYRRLIGVICLFSETRVDRELICSGDTHGTCKTRWILSIGLPSGIGNEG